MGVVLKKHNEEVYKKVEEMLNDAGKAAVVQPTGTGKTYVALRLIERTEGKTIFVAPTAHILNQVKETIENARRNGELSEEEYTRYQEVTYITYSSLMELSKIESGYENIILDEMHRCGAPEWGKGVQRLLESSNGAKVLGLTATPKRAVDNRDMALEMFGENIASEMTLEEAVAEGIIEAPTYISAIYSLQNVIIETEQKIEKLDDEGRKQELRKKISKIKRNLESAEGIEDIFATYANKPEGKYIVFCNDIKDMHKKMSEARKWFSKVGDIRLYEVSYKKSDTLNEDTIRRFREEGEKINLLFTVDKLNEGIHVDGIDGVIMLRSTSSPIVFMQQLGRALSAGNEGTPLVFDFVNNLENSSYREVQEFVQRVQRIRQERDIENETIKNIEIIELQREVKEVLNEINSKLERESSYLKNARKIKQWMDERDTTKPPSQASKDGLEKRLGQALAYIRKGLIKPYEELKTEEEREEYKKRHPELEEVMKILQEITIPTHLRNAREIIEWREKNQRKPSLKSNDELEIRLARSLIRIKNRLTTPYTRLKTEEEREEYRKKHPELEEVMKIVDEIEEKKISKYLRNARKIKQWMEEKETTKPPSEKSKDELEKKLGIALANIKSKLTTPYRELKTDEEREEYRKKYPELEEVMKIVDEIDENNVSQNLRNARQIKQWMEERETTKPPTQNSKDKVEKKLGTALSYIKTVLVNPYRELKTDEEREEYRKKYPEIEEVMKIVDEIDEKNPRSIDMVTRTLKIAEVLNSNGVKLNVLIISKKDRPLLLSEIEQDGVDIQKIIEENELDGTFAFGSNVINLRKIYKGTRGKNRKRELTKDEIELAKDLGLIIETETAVSKVFRIAQILKNNGVNLQRLDISKKIILEGRKKQLYLLLSELEQEGVDIKKIIEENGLDGNIEFGNLVHYLRRAYNGTAKSYITEEEKRQAEELGLITQAMMEKQKKLQSLVQTDSELREKVDEARALETEYEKQLGMEQIK